MELDRNLLQEIGNMDDETLRGVIGSICSNMGLDPKMASAYLSDMGKIKKTVMGLTEEDLNRVEQALGEENTRNLVETLRREARGS